MTEATERDRRAAAKAQAEPLRLLLGGQVNAGKSSLINALLNEIRAASDALPLTSEFTAYELKREGVPQALIIDSPGLDSPEQPLESSSRRRRRPISSFGSRAPCAPTASLTRARSMPSAPISPSGRTVAARPCCSC